MNHTSSNAAPLGPELPWHLASTLAERLTWSAEPTETDPERGTCRLDMWRELKAFSGDRQGRLADWLGYKHLSIEDFTVLLGEAEASLRARRTDEPEWYRTFRRWWGAAAHDGLHRLEGDVQLLEWGRPLIEGAMEELATALADRAAHRTDPVFKDDEIVERFLDTVPLPHLHVLIQRAAVLELNVFRVEGRLTGDDSGARFNDFCRQLATESVAISLWEEYCVLARLVVTQLRFWIESQLELFEALAGDLDRIRTDIPGMADAGRLVSVSIGEGDRHRRGRSVGILRFDSGAVVYKPRSLAMDDAYIRLIDWINALEPSHDLTYAATLDCGEYGWVQFIESEQAVDAAGARRFAWRVGALAAVLYTLHATDFHFENVIASGDQPVLIDLETLLHSDKTDAVAKVEGTVDVTAIALAESVHSTGLLPNPIIMRDDDGTHALDMSGASGRGGQQTPMPVPTFEGAETDAMRLVKQRMEIDGESNQPVAADGTPFDIAHDRDAVVAGFAELYELLRSRATELLAPGGPLAAFEHLHTRYIARPTHVYGMVLLESTHPDFLRDGLDRDRSLARLNVGHEDRAERAAMIEAETAELTDGDVPVFTIETSTGVLYGDTPPRPLGRRDRPIRAVADRIRALGGDDRFRQQWIVDATLAATTMVGTEARWPNWSQPLPADPAGTGDFEEQALAVGRRIQRLFIRGEDTMGWLGLDLVDEQHWMLAPAPLGLYNGIGGITHGLDAVAAVTADRSLAEDTARLYDYMLRRVQILIDTFENPDPAKPLSIDITPVGALNDLAGTVYVLAHAAARHSRSDCAEAALQLLPILDELADQDRNFDVVSGSAGLILVMESLEAVAPGRGARALAHRAACRLLDARSEFDSGWGWISPMNDGVALTGFSHGSSGIAAAFARVNALDPREEYREAIARALAYEHATIDAETGLWTDLRPVNVGGRTAMNAWCHGAPGIGLARHMILGLDGHGLDPQGLRDDRDRAARILDAAGWNGDPVTGTGNHSICHGDVGNLLILDAIGTDPELQERLPHLWKALLTDGSTNGWLCGVPHGIETPGLMTGLAGIAWGLARKADPTRIADLLQVAAPAGGERHGGN